MGRDYTPGMLRVRMKSRFILQQLQSRSDINIWRYSAAQRVNYNFTERSRMMVVPRKNRLNLHTKRKASLVPNFRAFKNQQLPWSEGNYRHVVRQLSISQSDNRDYLSVTSRDMRKDTRLRRIIVPKKWIFAFSTCRSNRESNQIRNWSESEI